jgi:hypothetical protein
MFAASGFTDVYSTTMPTSALGAERSESGFDDVFSSAGPVPMSRGNEDPFAPDVYRNIEVDFDDMQLAAPHMLAPTKSVGGGFDDAFSNSFSLQQFPNPNVKSSLGGFDNDIFSFGGVAPEPQPEFAPDYIDTNHSFSCNAPASTVLASVEQCLRDNNIDFNTKSHKFKITAVLYDGALPSRFNVRLYRQHPTAGTTVEFQKSEGCELGFRALFCHVSSVLGVSQPKPTFRKMNMSLPPMDDADVLAVSAADVDAIIVNLMGTVAHSKSVDQQKQAAAALVDVNVKHGKQLMKTEGMVAVLMQLLTSPDEDLVRCAALVLAQAASHIDDEAETLLGPLFQAMISPASLVNTDTKRHLSCALAEVMMAPTCFSESRPFPRELVSYLRMFSGSADATLRTNIQKAEASLVARRAITTR